MHGNGAYVSSRVTGCLLFDTPTRSQNRQEQLIKPWNTAGAMGTALESVKVEALLADDAQLSQDAAEFMRRFSSHG